MRIGVGFFVLLMMLLCSGRVMAQYGAGAGEIGFNAGMAIPITKTDLTDFGGDEAPMVKNGLNFGGRLLYHVDSGWAIGGDVSYVNFGEKDNKTTTVVLNNQASAIDVELFSKYYVLPGKKFSPYLAFGIGYGTLQDKMRAKPAAGYAWSDTHTTEYRENFDQSMGGLSTSIGLGFESFLSDDVAFVVEGMLKSIRVDKHIMDNFGTDWKFSGNSSINITAGLSMRIGR